MMKGTDMVAPSKSLIPWTDTTWSPVTGCTKVSQGCKNCYAEREVKSRWSKNPKSVFYGRPFTDIQCHPDKLEQPLHWKKPKKVFVCPRGDLFHPEVPDRFIDQVFAGMAWSPQHTFQVLTKRPDRMMEYMSNGGRPGRIDGNRAFLAAADQVTTWPLPNVWMGVSIEDQESANERIPLLLKTPAAVRWISAEPILGAVDLHQWLGIDRRSQAHTWERGGVNQGISWVVAGGESGPHARPMHPDWVRTLRDQCKAADVPFNFKQWGEWSPDWNGTGKKPEIGGWTNSKQVMWRVGVYRAGRLLDGALHDEYPEVNHG